MRLHVIIDIEDDALSDGDDASEIANEIVSNDIQRDDAYNDPFYYGVEVIDAEWRTTKLRLQ